MRDWFLKSSQRTDRRTVSTIAYVIITALIAVSLCGCSKITDAIKGAGSGITPGSPSPASQSSPGAIQVIDMNGDVHETSVDVIDAAEAEDDQSSALPARSLAEVAANMSFSDDKSFAYNGLDDDCRRCYMEIYAILLDMLEKVDITSHDTEEIDLAFRAVMIDHPEIFYVKGYSIGKYMSGKTVKKIVFSGTYTMSRPDRDRAKERVDAYVENVITNCPEGAGDFDRIKYVYDYLIRNNEYVIDSENNQNVLSVVDNGRTVCQGYTKAMQLILNRMGMFCTVVNGKACGRNGVPDADDLKDSQNAEWGGHVWNIVKCNGMYYNVDVTWGDAAITLMHADGTTSSDIDINYEFFLVDDATMTGTHDPEPVVRMPKCNSMEDNYYNHEGVYFTRVDDDQLYRAFEKGYASGENHVFLKAASDEVYKELKEHLFDRENVFRYMGRTNVRYVEFRERNLIMISL